MLLVISTVAATLFLLYKIEATPSGMSDVL